MSQKQPLATSASLCAGFPGRGRAPRIYGCASLSAGSPGAAGDGQSRKTGVPGGGRGPPARHRRVVLQHHPPLPPVRPTGGSGTVVNAAATVQQHFLRTSLRGAGEGAEKGLIQQFQGVRINYTPVQAAEPRADSEALQPAQVLVSRLHISELRLRRSLGDGKMMNCATGLLSPSPAPHRTQ